MEKRIKYITLIDNWIYVILDGKKLLIGDKTYDVTKYDEIKNILKLDSIYIIDINYNLIDIKTNEIILCGNNISNISKYKDDILIINLKNDANQKFLFDIESKRLLPISKNYDIVYYIKNKMYVLKNQITNK